MEHPSVCYHCGEPLPDREIYIKDNTENKHFCCVGCKSVFEILQGNGLEGYYASEITPGISQKEKSPPKAYEYLDQEEAFEKLIRFREGDRVHIDLRIPDIHCASCVWLLERLPEINAGILSSEVRFLEKKLLLRFDLSKISISQIALLVANLGYPPNISLQDLEGQNSNHQDKSFYYRLGIAGFCMGNIMLMSFPEYLGLTDPQFKGFFAWTNLALSLPVIFYSAYIFFKSAYDGLKHGNLNIDVPVSLGILALFSQSVFEILSQQGPGYLDSLAGLVFFLLAGRWFQKKSYEKLSFDRNFRSYFPIAAKVIKEGKESSVLLSKLAKGDIIFVRNQELIPADGILLDPHVSIDYSYVSGESDPVHKIQEDKLFAGGKVVGKGVRIQLTNTVSESYLTQLWNAHGDTSEKDQGIQFLADKLSKKFTLIILSIAFLAGAYWFFQENLQVASQISVAVLIVACPCGLALSSPIVLGNAMRILGNNGFFLKNTEIIEQLEQIDEVVFDKTGTLTLSQRHETLAQLHSLPLEQQASIAALVKESTHPVSRQIQRELATVSPTLLLEAEEIAGKGLSGRTIQHIIQIGNDRMLNENLDSSLAEGSTGISIDSKLVAEFTRNEKIRPALKQVLTSLGKKFGLSLLTGDSAHRAEALKGYFPNSSQFLSKQLPKDKLDYIKSLQDQGHKVMMIGDGLNDAGALIQSEVGIVMAEKLDSFSPACEVIMDAKSFPKLPDLLLYGNRAIKLLKMGLIISLLYNLVGLGFAVQGLLSPLVAAILMPASSISIILWGLGSTYLLARHMKLDIRQKD